MNKAITAFAKEYHPGERAVTAYASKPELDRYNELILSDAWDLKNFKKNPVLLLSHNYYDPPIGKVMWIKADDDGLKFKAWFADTEMGKEIESLYQDGIMNAFSVGFLPKENGYRLGTKKTEPSVTYTDVELLEISAVSVPALPSALVNAYRDGKIKTKGLQEFIADNIPEDDGLKEELESVKAENDELKSAIEILKKEIEELKNPAVDYTEYIEKKAGEMENQILNQIYKRLGKI